MRCANLGRHSVLHWIGAFGLALACERTVALPATDAPVPEPGPAERDVPAPSDASAPNEAPRARAPVVLVTAPAVLADLQARGLDLGAVAFGRPAGTALDNSALARDARWAAIVRTLGRDLDRLRARDPKAGVGLRFVHRLFDIAWLRSPEARFELVAVVNRIDRRPFAPEHCGETRLVYRLAYTTRVGQHEVSSRLPMTVNVVFFAPSDRDGGCRGAATRWMLPSDEADDALAHRLVDVDGPLAATRLTADTLKSVEIDLQSVRWPSTIRPDMAGHAGYVLRVFRPDGDAMVPAPLENTPDVDRLRQRPAERAALLTWLRDPANLAALRDGTAVVPDRFVATMAESFTPRGLGRRGNRPYARLFAPEDFADLPLADRDPIGSPVALLRRLDELSCQGCHQTRSVAGFHMLGLPRDEAQVIDALAVAGSPHLLGDLARRREVVRRLAAGEPVDDARPLADVGPDPGGWGEACSLGDPGLAAFACKEGLLCRALGDPEMGACLPERSPTAGDACEIGRIKAADDPARDRVVDVHAMPCDAKSHCETNGVGFPAGMCTAGCGALQAGEACGRIVALRPFNDCLARHEPFAHCVTTTSFAAAMRACDDAHPCRDDYICARRPDPTSDGGVCLPPYFLFQLRVDGHRLSR